MRKATTVAELLFRLAACASLACPATAQTLPASRPASRSAGWPQLSQLPPERSGTASRPAMPSQGTEKAALEGLRWLLRHQGEDGSWSLAAVRACCDPEHPCVPAGVAANASHDVGLTALALLAFLECGYWAGSPQSMIDTVRGKRHQLGPAIGNGLDWLVRQQQADGGFGRHVDFYSHALATRALCQACVRADSKDQVKPAERAVQFLLRAQQPAAGAASQPASLPAGASRPAVGGFGPLAAAPATSRPNLVATACAWSALDVARRAELRVPQAAFDGIAAWAKQMVGTRGLVGFSARGEAGRPMPGAHPEFADHPALLSAVCSLLQTPLPSSATDAFHAFVLQRIGEDLPVAGQEPRHNDYLYWHAASRALWRLDGPRQGQPAGRYWSAWCRLLPEVLLPLQEPGRNCGLGGWLVPDRWSTEAGPVFATALNMLTVGTAWDPMR